MEFVISFASAVAGTLLGWVLRDRTIRKLELELATVAPTLAALKVAVDSIALALRGHLQMDGHPVMKIQLHEIERRVHFLEQNRRR